MNGIKAFAAALKKSKDYTDTQASMPTGMIIQMFAETAPEGFLICDGTEYKKSDYPELSKLLLGLTTHTQFEGSDSDHFKVPDLRGEFIRGTGTNGHTNQGSGANVGVHQDGTITIPPYQTNGYNFGIYKSSTIGTGFAAQYTNADKELNDRVYYAETSASGTGQTGGAAITSRPTNTTVLYCIKAK